MSDNKGNTNGAALVSIIVPCLNERQFIGSCLDSVIANDYPRDKLEIIVVDGMSKDGTRTIIEDYRRRYTFIRLMDNPQGITPAALNIGISAATGEIILRLDAHAHLDKHYISACIDSLRKYQPDNVGGIMITSPRENGLLGKAIAFALSHHFGVGNSHFRAHPSEPRWVDTVFGGCYKREVFDRVGLFNEALSRGQDLEFNLRLKKAGGRTLLVPDIVSHYHARSDVRSFWWHNWNNGVWAILPFAYSDVMPVSWRHLVPLAFVSGLVLAEALSFFRPAGLWLLAIVAGSYGTMSFLASTQIAWRERDLRYLVAMPLIFGSLHLGYGLGSMWGVVKLMAMPAVWGRLIGLEVRCGTARG